MSCCAPIDLGRIRRPPAPSRARPIGRLLGVLLAIAPTMAAAGDSAPQRLTVRASLLRLAQPISDGRHVVRAVLTPQAAHAPERPATWVGTLEPKSTAALCYGPGYIFHDSFEGSLP